VAIRAAFKHLSSCLGLVQVLRASSYQYCWLAGCDLLLWPLSICTVAGPDATANESSVITAAATVPVLPTSGTTDPVVLASIGPAPDISVEPAVIMAAAISVATAADPSAPEQPQAGSAGTPRTFTRSQYARAVAALRRMSRVAGLAQGVVQTAAVPADQQQAALSGHNVYRATHNAPALTWDNTIAGAAEAWATRCMFQHQSNSPYGENLFYTSAKAASASTMTTAVQLW
jgi:hypothetical protein